MKTLYPKPRAGYKGMQYLPFPRSRKGFLLVISAEVVLVGCFSFLHAWSVQSQQPSSASTQSGTPAVAPKSSTILITAQPKDGTPAGLSTSDIEIKADGKPVPCRRWWAEPHCTTASSSTLAVPSVTVSSCSKTKRLSFCQRWLKPSTLHQDTSRYGWHIATPIVFGRWGGHATARKFRSTVMPHSSSNHSGI